MFVARRIDRAEIIGGGNERDFGDMFFGQRLSFAEVHRVVRAKGGCPDVFPVFYRLVINLIKVFVAGVNEFGIDIVGFCVNAVDVFPFRAAQMFDRHARDGFVRFAVPKVLVFGKPSSRRLIGGHNTFAEDGQAEVSRYEHENERAFCGVRLKIFHHWENADPAVFFREVAAVGVGVYDDCLVRVAGAFKDCVERFRFCVVVDIADKAQRCGFFVFRRRKDFFAVCFVHPKHGYAEISQNKVENLSLDHCVGHIFPDADHAFHARQFRRPEREQRLDERRADGTAVTFFDFKVFGHGRALIECDFTADF